MTASVERKVVFVISMFLLFVGCSNKTDEKEGGVGENNNSQATSIVQKACKDFLRRSPVFMLNYSWKDTDSLIFPKDTIYINSRDSFISEKISFKDRVSEENFDFYEFEFIRNKELNDPDTVYVLKFDLDFYSERYVKNNFCSGKKMDLLEVDLNELNFDGIYQTYVIEEKDWEKYMHQDIRRRQHIYLHISNVYHCRSNDLYFVKFYERRGRVGGVKKIYTLAYQFGVLEIVDVRYAD